MRAFLQRAYGLNDVNIVIEQPPKIEFGEYALPIAFELALFVEAGRVFHTFTALDTRQVQTVIGAGIRLVVLSQIVAKIDAGLGSEGTVIFAGLHYPF